MIVTRFCSKKEFDAFMSGENLINETDHFKGGAGGSQSRGFCFSPDKPKVCFEYLKGIVDTEVCMVLHFQDGYLTESLGKYRDVNRESIDGLPCATLIRELCCTKYNNKIATLIWHTNRYHELCPNASDIRECF